MHSLQIWSLLSSVRFYEVFFRIADYFIKWNIFLGAINLSEDLILNLKNALQAHLTLKIIIIILLIIYNDFLPKSRRGSHVKSDYAHTIIKQTPLRSYTMYLRLDFQLLRPFYSFAKPHHVTASHSFPGDNPPKHGGWFERTQSHAKVAVLNSTIYICTRALHSFLAFVHCCAASIVIPLLLKAIFTPSTILYCTAHFSALPTLWSLIHSG